jgi:hypothetical protein
MSIVIRAEGRPVGRISLTGGVLAASSNGTRRLADYALRRAAGDAARAYQALGTLSNGYLDASEEPDVPPVAMTAPVTISGQLDLAFDPAELSAP